MSTTKLSQKLSFLEIIDLFGQSVGIRYNEKQYHRTKFGGLVTLSIWGFIMYNIVNIGLVLFQQNNPTVIQQESYIGQQPLYELKPNEFVIAFGLQDADYKHFFDENIYSIQAYQSEQNRNLSLQGDSSFQQEKYKIEIERCSKKHFQIESTKEYFYSLPYKDMYCLSLNQSSGKYPAIEGEFSGNRFKSIEFQVHECNHKNCNTTAQAKELLRKPTLGVYFQNYALNITERNHPFQPIGKNLFWTTGPEMEKDIVISLVNNKIISDFGWVSEEEVINQQIAYSSQREMVLTRSNSQIFRATVLYEKNKEILVFRKYLKLVQAFSQVGGLFNFIIAIGYIICRPFSQVELNRKLLNSLYDIEDNSEEKKISQKSQLNEDMRKSIFSKPFESLPSQVMKMQQSSRIKDSNIMVESQKRNIQGDKCKQLVGKQVKQIGFLENIMNCFRCFMWCQTPKSRLINHATKNIYSHIDIFNIIRKLIEVDKLKQLLLNEHQIRLFEYLPRPQLHIDTFLDNNYKKNIFTKNRKNISTQQEIESEQQTFNEEEILKALREDYLFVKKHQNESVFDRNIIKMLDQNLKQKLEEKLPQNIGESDQPNPLQIDQMKEELREQFMKSQIDIPSCSSMNAKISIDNPTSPHNLKEIFPFPRRDSLLLHSPTEFIRAQTPKLFETKEMISQKNIQNSKR